MWAVKGLVTASISTQTTVESPAFSTKKTQTRGNYAAEMEALVAKLKIQKRKKKAAQKQLMQMKVDVETIAELSQKHVLMCS